MANIGLALKLFLMFVLTVVTIIASLIMLPKAKSLMMALQVANKAKEAELDHGDD